MGIAEGANYELVIAFEAYRIQHVGNDSPPQDSLKPTVR